MMGLVGNGMASLDNEFGHIPVLLGETIDLLAPVPGGTYVDCTLGGAGHSLEILQRIQLSGRLICIDWDERAITAAKRRMHVFGDAVTIVRGSFGRLEEILEENGVTSVNGIVYDLGVSSPQLDDSSRGFSYMSDAALDMRMDRRGSVTAADLVNTLPVDNLAKLIYEYGEERWATRIAKFIATAREADSIKTTYQLVDIIKAAVPASARKAGPHPAKRTFQALRIAVNDELTEFAKSLEQAIRRLASGGRVCVISFHSLEDRIAKETFVRHSRSCVCPPEIPICACDHKAVLRNLTKKPIEPSEREINANPRARSAKLRGAQKL